MSGQRVDSGEKQLNKWQGRKMLSVFLCLMQTLWILQLAERQKKVLQNQTNCPGVSSVSNLRHNHKRIDLGCSLRFFLRIYEQQHFYYGTMIEHLPLMLHSSRDQPEKKTGVIS